jgi:Bacterial regulatory proteins, gntR family
MHQFSPPKNATETQETEKVPFLVVKRIREAILDEVFKPGDHLGEVELAERFEVSRSPVVIVYDSEGEAYYPWEALKEKPTATVTAREFIEYLESMAATERRDEERREADRDALWR